MKLNAKEQTTPEELVSYYRQMLTIRRFEEKAGQLYGMGHIGGFCHLYIGQEAVVVGLESVAAPGDQRVTSYRDHGHMIACGMDPGKNLIDATVEATEASSSSSSSPSSRAQSWSGYILHISQTTISG